MSLLNQLIERLRTATSITKDSKLLLAVSGGVDSMVMLHLFQQLPAALLPQLAVVHIQHQLRSDDQLETTYLKQYCEVYQLPFYSKKWPETLHPDSGIEEAARVFRYQVFREVMNEQQCTHLVLAHHGEDQMETILMKLTRGSSLAGVAGMKVERPFFKHQLVRPLLFFSKTVLYDYAREHQLQYFEDESNTSLDYTRNRYRLAMLPFLKEENAQAMTHFQQFSEALHEMLEIATPVIKDQLKQIQLSQGKCISIEKFLDLPVYFHRPILGEWLHQQLTSKDVLFNQEHLGQIEGLIKSKKPNQSVDLPKGYQVKKSYQYLELCKRKHQEEVPIEKFSLAFGETIVLPLGEKLTLTDTTHFQPKARERYIYLAKESISLPLTIRHRMSGDRMTLKGLATGSKKIKDIFIDQKVPKEMREQAYLILDQEKKVICLLNYKESRLSIAQETDKIQYILIISKMDE